MKATFKKMRNNMFWEFIEYDEHPKKSHFHKLVWTGYDDQHWWDNAPGNANMEIKTCTCGRKYRLDYETAEVTLLND